MMEQLQENKLANADVTEASAPVSVGRLLREGRERMGWSVEDVVNQIKLAPRQVVALEADDFESLPETAFVRGFVRSYAKVLRLDVDQLLAALPGASAVQTKADPFKVDAPFPVEQTVRRQNLKLLFGALLVVLLIGVFTLWQSWSPQPALQEAVVADAAMIATPVALPAPDVAASGVADSSGTASSGVISSGAISYAASVVAAVDAASAVPPLASPAPADMNTQVSKLHLSFDKESWTEVKDQWGKILTRKLNMPGSELNLEGRAPFTLVVGHASSVHLMSQGKPVDLTPFIDASNDVARLTLP